MLFPNAPQSDHLEDSPIVSHAFWPEISPNDVRETMRIDKTVTVMRLRMALIEAISTVNQQLADWRREQFRQGYQTLAEVPTDEEVDGISNKLLRYRRAVYCYAAAEIMERYSNFDSAAAGTDRAEAKLKQAVEYSAEGHAAIADILEQPRVAVHLI